MLLQSLVVQEELAIHQQTKMHFQLADLVMAVVVGAQVDVMLHSQLRVHLAVGLVLQQALEIQVTAVEDLVAEKVAVQVVMDQMLV